MACPTYDESRDYKVLKVSMSPTFYTAFLLLQFGIIFLGERILVKKLLKISWWNWLKASISPTFYVQFLHTQIQKAQKRLTAILYFLRFWDLVKCWWNWLKDTIYHEARGESREGQIAVAWVIINRANHAGKRWPDNIAGVCKQECQFECWSVSFSLLLIHLWFCSFVRSTDYH